VKFFCVKLSAGPYKKSYAIHYEH